MMDVLSDKKVKIRKPQQCGGCLLSFPVGAELSRQVIADEGRVWSFYMCPACEGLMDYYDDNHDGYPEGFAREMMGDDKFKGTPSEYLEYCKNNYDTIAEIEKKLKHLNQ